jgi:hypothetical protein
LHGFATTRRERTSGMTVETLPETTGAPADDIFAVDRKSVV